MWCTAKPARPHAAGHATTGFMFVLLGFSLAFVHPCFLFPNSSLLKWGYSLNATTCWEHLNWYLIFIGLTAESCLESEEALDQFLNAVGLSGWRRHFERD
jgi:hypothetical protein